METIRAASFGTDFWGSFERSAWRLELLDEYDEPATRERMAMLRRGEMLPPRAEWIAGLRAAKDQGRTVGRVHVIGELTEYLRYEIAVYRQHATAGEDIRILPAATAAGLDLPDFDFWLLDRAAAVRMLYGERGVFLGSELITDTATVARCVRARDEAVRHAMPVGEWIERQAAA